LLGRLTDAEKPAVYEWNMKTTVDIDEGVLREAEAQARYQGKPLGALVEDALRVTLKTAAGYWPVATPPEADPGLEDNDPFAEPSVVVLTEAVASARRPYLEGGGQRSARPTTNGIGNPKSGLIRTNPSGAEGRVF
jgi:hypothetical protein